MKNRLLPILLCAVFLLFTGCRLARPEPAESGEVQEDRLIGAFITKEHLDTFDFDDWARDNAAVLAGGGDAELSEQDAAAYQERIWATQTAEGDYVFEGLEGVGFYAPVFYEEGSESGRRSHLDAGLVSSGLHYTARDDGDDTELDCTLYVTPGEIIRYYCNPVYQTADRQVYLTSGDGMSTNAENREGELCSSTVSASSTVTKNGASRTDSCKFTLHVAIMFEPTAVTVLQMGEDSQILDRQEYKPDRMPESISLTPGCAYAVAETHKLDGNGAAVVTRELIDMPRAEEDDMPLLTTYRTENGLFCQQETTLIPAGT